MSIDFKQKRIDFINKWPKSDLFPKEKEYKEKCDNFANTATLFTPYTLWYSGDKEYNIATGSIIDALETMPYKPDKAFFYIFIGFENYSEQLSSQDKITPRLKEVIDAVDLDANGNSDLDAIIKLFCSSIPTQLNVYFIDRINSNSMVRNRITKDQHDHIITNQHDLVEAILRKYPDLGSNVVSKREAACLLKKIFNQESVSVDNYNCSPSRKLLLYFLFLGILYTLRNDNAHGSSISSTKSSKTTFRRYAMNHFAYLATYTFLIYLLIKKDDASLFSSRITQLKANVEENIKQMKRFFGSNLS